MYNQQPPYGYNQKQLDFLDILNICSFVVGLQNLEENMNQGDKQEILNDFSEKADYLLQEIHRHLQMQDDKIDELLMRLDRIENILEKGGDDLSRY